MTDISGLNELIADLSAAPGKAQRKVDGIVKKGAQNVRDDARRLSEGIRYAPAYPRSITFDSGWNGSTYEAEIGPDKDLAQGALGNILEYGIPSKNTAPHAHLGPALDLEGPRLEQAISDLGGEVL